MNTEQLNNRPILKLYDTGDEVKILQEKLKILDLFPGSITGSFGKNTEDSVKIFQEQNNLVVDGIVGPNTWDLLYEQTALAVTPIPMGRVQKPTLSLGDTGEFVTILQNQLKDILYYNGNVTGNFDKNTENAVKQFQMNNKLTADGIVGRDTWSALTYLYSPLAICNGEVEQNTYTVVSGDTLWSIARKFGMTVDELKRLNNLTSNIISIGQVLTIKESEEPTDNIYIVVPGDTLYSIARRYNTTVSELMNLNNLTSNIISIGQTLKIPDSSIPSYTTYTVIPGDTLYSIARKNNTTVDELKRLNNLTNNIISIGQTLKIPK